MTTYVYAFDAPVDHPEPKRLLGGKGAGLAEMTRLGIPVPPGFTISTDACNEYQRTGRIPEGLKAQVNEALATLEARMGRKLGDPNSPLLVSVRSGAAISMPGMMDTILNLGLNDATVEALAAQSNDRRFALDAYRRLLEMYADVVMDVSRDHFEHALADIKRAHKNLAMADHEVPAESLDELVTQAKSLVQTHAGAPFPQSVEEQLWGAIEAVFKSWNNPRAIRYRRMQHIPDELGTAVNVQAMVFGNMGHDCGSGVAFTRNPATGEKRLYGEFLPNAQGEDVVAGIRTPRPVTAEAAVPGREAEAMENYLPEAFKTLQEISVRLEKHFGDLQDIEFTIEKGEVFILQTRSGKRTAQAAVRIAVDLVNEGLCDTDSALMKVDAEALQQLLHARLPTPDELGKKDIHALASGLPASPGAAIGEIVFDADEAVKRAQEGRRVVLVRRETSPEDIHGMKAAEGIVTATGGMTSHAAVVARGLGKCCVAGCSTINVDYASQKVSFRRDGGTVELSAGDVISLDGTYGRIYQGALEVQAAAKVPEFDTVMEWADARRTLKVRANADTPHGARTARSFGAQGIGLCRTEHMFFAEDRLTAVRCMALAETDEKRAAWLEKIGPMQKEDFEEIFTAMDGLPVTVRLLDWPLHEFLPREDAEFEEIAAALGTSEKAIRQRALNLSEVNPMIGHRGVRVGLIVRGIYEMQTRAIVEAAVACQKQGVAVHPEIMVPVVCLASELSAMSDIIRRTVASTLEALGAKLEYQVGTMIELPRACLVAGDLAKTAEFFSFGTNDLTQTTFGISRDDAGHFLPAYLDDPRGLLQSDPFATIDEAGVGELVRLAVERGRGTRSDLKLGICGEHGGEPRSVDFAQRVGLDYVSCSPPRLPVARLAAAQAAVRASSRA